MIPTARGAACAVSTPCCDWHTASPPHGQLPDGASPLVTALARLYAEVYGGAEAGLRAAAGHRASAMDISDEWVAQGCDPASPLLAAERALLVRSYAELLAAVHG